MKIINLFLVAFMVASVFASCKTDGGTGKKKTASGYDYVVHTATDGKKAAPEDWVSFAISVVGDNGKVLQEVLDGPNLPSLQIPAADAPAGKPNPIQDVLASSSVGDSITIMMPVDSLGGSANPQLAGLTYVEYVIKVKEILSDSDRKAKVEADRLEAEALAEVSKARESEVAEMVKQNLADYKAGKLKAVEKDGLQIIVHDEGSGKVVEEGNRASMQYYGVLKTTGEQFDNSYKRGRPFTFTVGRGEVITGWDKGVPGLKKGAKATLIIPFDMAYGEADRPGIPAKSDLVFYVEVEDVN